VAWVSGGVELYLVFNETLMHREGLLQEWYSNKIEKYLERRVLSP
jgi:hypothetical protein